MTGMESEKLERLKDDELMNIYAQQLMSSPNEEIVYAIGQIMERRNIKAGSMVIAFNYKDSKGKERVITLMEV